MHIYRKGVLLKLCEFTIINTKVLHFSIHNITFCPDVRQALFDLVIQPQTSRLVFRPQGLYGSRCLIEHCSPLPRAHARIYGGVSANTLFDLLIQPQTRRLVIRHLRLLGSQYSLWLQNLIISKNCVIYIERFLKNLKTTTPTIEINDRDPS